MFADFQGEIAALSGSFLWATTAVVYNRLGQHIPPLVLNLAKGAIAIALLLLTLIFQGDLLPTINTRAVMLLLLSGAVGIGIGDTAFFAALNALGSRKTLLLETLAPPLAAAIALISLQEWLSWGAWCGILLTVSGVAWVISERTAESGSGTTNPIPGVGLGVLAALAQAAGAVLSRAALAHTNINPLWSSLIRVLAGAIFIFPLVLARRENPYGLKILQSKRLFSLIFLAAFASTYLGIWLQQIAFKFSATGIAQTLLSTSPLFVLPIAIAIGEKVSLRAFIGAAIALIGIALLFLGNS